MQDTVRRDGARWPIACCPDTTQITADVAGWLGGEELTARLEDKDKEMSVTPFFRIVSKHPFFISALTPPITLRV